MFSEILEKLLAERGISALTLSKEIGIPKSILYEWKSGKREPSTANLRRLADYFGVTPGYLLGREEKTVIVANGLKDNQLAHITQIVNDFIELNNK